jgi:multimeric flavodoxin WrbA
MTDIIAIYGSPRRKGNSAALVEQAVRGARDAGARVEEIRLRDYKITPCLEIYQCKKSGTCAINDDFQKLQPLLESCDGMILASPIFFYAVSAHLKGLMDRCNLYWVKKYIVDETPLPSPITSGKKGLFISTGATKGKKLFEGATLSVRYFLDALDIELWQTLLCRDLDDAGDILKHPEYLQEAHANGQALVEALKSAGR